MEGIFRDRSSEDRKGTGSKRVRQSVKAACDLCRQKKQACDGQNPCSSCQKRDLTCHYDQLLKAGETRQQGARRELDDTRKLLDDVTHTLEYLKQVPDSYGSWVLNALKSAEKPLDALIDLPKNIPWGAGVPTLGPTHAGPSSVTGSAVYGPPSEYKCPNLCFDPLEHDGVPMSLRPSISHQEPSAAATGPQYHAPTAYGEYPQPIKEEASPPQHLHSHQHISHHHYHHPHTRPPMAGAPGQWYGPGVHPDTTTAAVFDPRLQQQMLSQSPPHQHSQQQQQQRAGSSSHLGGGSEKAAPSRPLDSV